MSARRPDTERRRPGSGEGGHDGGGEHLAARVRELEAQLAVRTAELHEAGAKQGRDEAERRVLARRWKAAAERSARLLQVTAALSEAATPAQVAQVVLGQGFALLGAKSGVLARRVADEAQLRLVMTGYDDEARRQHARMPLDADRPSAAAVRTGRSFFAEDRAAALSRFPGLRADAERNGTEALVALPLVTARGVIGAVVATFGEARSFAEEDRDFVSTLANACAQALDRAELYEQERDTARALQRSLLPSHLPELAEATVAARYLAGDAGAGVGGDWYDVIALPGGTVGMAIGDVAGHGVRAAAIMGQVRNALRAYALEGHPPAGVVARANRLLAVLEPDEVVTCCYLELNSGNGTASVVRAGHPPPLVVGPGDRAHFVAVEGSLPLGVDAEASYAETTVLLAPGSTVVLYTDGIVENRTLPLDQGLAHLEAAAAAGPSEDVEALLGHLVTVLGAADSDDDVALVALRYSPVEPGTGLGATASRRLPADAASAAAARHFTADVLAQWGVGALADSVELCVSELVTNAVVHTASDVEVCLAIDARNVRVEVADDSERPPTLQEADDDATSGRGLFIVEAVADAWGTTANPIGKSVWFELARPPAAGS